MAPSRRDNFPMSVKRILAERAQLFCSLCRQSTAGPSLRPERSVRAGDAAHITAASSGGPRYDPGLSREERRSAENGIWLCGTHADLVDRDDERYTADDLRRIKSEHEARITRMLERQHPPEDEAMNTALAALAIHRIREIGVVLSGPGWDRVDDAVAELVRYGDRQHRYPVDVGREYLAALDRVVGRMRGAVNAWRREPAACDALAHISGLVEDAIARLLPIASLMGRTLHRPTDPEVQLFGVAADLGGEMAYDGALYIWDLRVVEAGADVLWRVLRYGHLNEIGEIQCYAESEFQSAIDAARRSRWPDREHGLAFMEFKRKDAMSHPNGEPPRLPDEALAAIHAAHEARRAAAEG